MSLFTTESEVMVSTAAGVDATSAQVQAELQRVKGIVEATAGVWRGAAAASFASLMLRWDESACALQSALGDIATNIRSNATNFDTSDTDNAHTLNHLVGAGMPGLTF